MQALQLYAVTIYTIYTMGAGVYTCIPYPLQKKHNPPYDDRPMLPCFSILR